MGHAEQAALRYYDVQGTSGSNKRIAGFASLDSQRIGLERSGGGGGGGGGPPGARHRLRPGAGLASDVAGSFALAVGLLLNVHLRRLLICVRNGPLWACPCRRQPRAAGAAAAAPQFQGTPGRRAVWSGAETRILEKAAGEMLRTGRFCWELLKRDPAMRGLRPKTETQIKDKLKYLRKMYRKRQTGSGGGDTAQ